MSIARHQYEIYIRATPEEVFAAITDPEMTRQYFHGTSWDRPPVAGSAFSTSLPSGAPAVDGEVEVHDPPRRLVHTWHTVYDAELADEPVSRVEWIVEPAGEGLTRLRLEHSDLAQSPRTWDTVGRGWVWILDGLKTLLETGAPLPPPADAATTRSHGPDDIDADWHREQAAEANNSVWELLELAQRTPADDEEMLQRAYASRYHWARAARRGPEHTARGAWLLARVHRSLGRDELSLLYAEECRSVCLQHGLEDVDLAYAHESRARALQSLGRTAEAAAAWTAARSVPIEGADDRAHVEADLAEGP